MLLLLSGCVKLHHQLGIREIQKGNGIGSILEEVKREYTLAVKDAEGSLAVDVTAVSQWKRLSDD